ncbi:hypothetical protein ACFQQB_09265 [Nonomuraea rubra]|uniref:hypothetical protein n=1 Tax=Nonomuraea rubra TaxID=46180 RepID=UPI00360ED8F7
MDQRGLGGRDVRTVDGPGPVRVRCTPPAAAELFEIAVLDTTGGDGEARWHTIGWGVDRGHADSIAEAYVTRPCAPTTRRRCGTTVTWWGCTAGPRSLPTPAPRG